MASKVQLSPAYFLLASRLQEAALAMCHEDIRTRLQDCLRDSLQGTGNWGYIVAVFGDDKSGDVVYSVNSDLKKAAYTITAGATTIGTAAAVDVQPLTTYEPQSADVSEAGRRNSSRDQKQLQAIHDGATALGAACAAHESRASDVGIAAYTGASKVLGSAGNGSSNGALESGNPQVVPVGESSEVVPRERETSNKSTLQLVESATTLDAIILREARADYEIKLIAPGPGSSAFYPAEVLKRDGPKVFKEKTHVYLNHQTALEESQRPEGDVANLAGVLTTNAVYHEAHKNGPGLYARMKVFSDHAQLVEEKASHVGMSIRASGIAESGKTINGLKVLKELTHAESVDVVTRAGAGGMILTEAARTANPTEEAAMDAAELKKLNESVAAQAVINTKLLERAIRGDAGELARGVLKGITLAESSKDRVVESVLSREIPKTEAGELDKVKFAEAVTAEAKREGVYVAGLTNAGAVTGLGSAAEPAALTEAKKPEELLKEAVDPFLRLGLNEKAALRAAKGRAA